MAITTDQEAKLADIIERAAGSAELNDWEKNFMNDQAKRYEEHGSNINLSPKQWATLDRIEDVLTNGRQRR
jgi:hypothetical protein